jgi:uncharacterized membrane protein YdbT with pleckstrin-like domain
MLDLHHLPGSSLKESKIYTLRAHIITLLPLLLSCALVFVIPFLGYFSLQMYSPDIFIEPWHFTLFVLGASIFFLFGLLFIFQSFMDYWLDVFIVTDKRILDIQQKGLFNRTVSELRMYRIQDVTAEIKGFWRTIFNYGSIYIQTAGEKERFDFADIPRPNDVAKIILELSEEDRKEHLEEAVEDFGMPDNKITHQK